MRAGLSKAGSTLRVVEPSPDFDAEPLEALHFEAVEPFDINAISVAHVEAMALVGYQTAWADLCERALEPNIFLEPAFALPLLQHMRDRRPSFLLVWEEAGPASFGRLIGLFPVTLPGAPSLDGIARGFVHEQIACGTPLVDRGRTPEVLDAIFTWLKTARSVTGLMLTGIPTQGPFHAALGDFCRQSSRAPLQLETHERAILYPQAADIAVCHASPKRRKERARQRRRLSEVGQRSYTVARTPTEVAAAAERFLALEHNGWKGARGTALLANPSLATFLRTMTRLMAHEGKCRIDSIAIDGRPVAMGIVISAGDRAYYWKTAFDERFAALSPGVQFTIELTGTQLSDATIRSTDSCAIANHPMIDKLWPDRLQMSDLVVAIRPNKAWRFARDVAIERSRRGLRRHAKRLWHALRRQIRQPKTSN